MEYIKSTPPFPVKTLAVAQEASHLSLLSQVSTSKNLLKMTHLARKLMQDALVLDQKLSRWQFSLPLQPNM